MSLAAKVVSVPSGEKRTHLLIDDQPYQFLPNLAALYGDTIATMLQQLHWVMHTRPWYDGEELIVREFQGRMWIRVYSFMWFDTLHGICRHLSKSNFYKLRGEMKSSGVLLTRDNLDDDGDEEMVVNSNTKSEGPKWYAINIDLIHEDEKRYLEARNVALARRKTERAYIKKNDSSAQWRPRRGEDVSKPLDHCRVIFSEHQADELAEMGIGDGASTFRTRQVLAVDESDFSVSNNRTQRFHDLESVESDNGKHVSPDLGDTTLYDRETALEKAKTATTAQVSEARFVTPGGVAAVEMSVDNLPSPDSEIVARPKQTKTATSANTSNQTALPIMVAAAKPKRLPRDAAHQAAELTKRLLALAEEYVVELSEIDAAEIVGTWPQSSQGRPAIIGQINRMGLSKSVAAGMIQEDEVACRWQLACWDERPQAKVGYFKSEGGKVDKTRAGTFRAAVAKNWEPQHPEEWLRDLKGKIAERKRREQFEVNKAAANDYFESLSMPRRKRFLNDLLADRLREKGIFDVGSEAWQFVRVSMLLDPKVREQLEAWNAAPVAPVVAPIEEASTAIAPKVAARLALFVSRLRFAIEDGDFTREELGAKCRELAGVSTSEAAWIENQVLAVLEQRKAA